MVGPKIGEDLREKALLAIFYAILLMVIYIAGRFEYKWTMSIILATALAFGVYIVSAIGMSIIWLIAVAILITIGLCWFLHLEYPLGALIALFHDVVITIGAFALTNREVTLPVVAALLTIVGYSLNDIEVQSNWRCNQSQLHIDGEYNGKPEGMISQRYHRWVKYRNRYQRNGGTFQKHAEYQ